MTAAKLKKYFISKEFKDEYIYDGCDLGVTYSKEGSVFKVWAPTACKVSLNLYETGSMAEGGKCEGTYELTKMDKGVFAFDAKELGDLKNKFYTYSVTVDGKTSETVDVYTNACGVNCERSMIVDFNETNPDNWENDSRLHIKKSDAVIYELHIKDFSSDPNSGIAEEYRGKYKAFTFADTYLNGDKTTNFPTCVNYLKELGVTYVHLLPSCDFGSIDEATKNNDFNWGYDPMNYNVPEGSYSTNPYDGRVRIKEFKEMVQALHEAKIGVVMDVVYNHTYTTDSSFEKTVPHYYYRLNEDGTYSNGSACGNETCSEHEMYRKFMVDSLLFWAKEYHIDGFRFDLMGLHDTETMATIRHELNKLPYGDEIILYGEPWMAGPSAMEKGYIPTTTENAKHIVKGVDIFSDSIRDAVKGSVFIEDEPAYINSSDDKSVAFVKDLKAALLLENRVAYVSAHDNFTLYDKLILSTDEVDKTDIEHLYDRNENLMKMSEMAAGIVFTSPGMAFFQAGEEFLRTKYGEGDSYNSPIAINQLDWKRAYTNKDVVEYYKKLIALRKKYPQLSNADGSSDVKFFYIAGADENVVSFTINDNLLIIYNPNVTSLDMSALDCKNNILGDENNTKIISPKTVAVYEI